MDKNDQIENVYLNSNITLMIKKISELEDISSTEVLARCVFLYHYIHVSVADGKKIFITDNNFNVIQQIIFKKNSMGENGNWIKNILDKNKNEES